MSNLHGRHAVTGTHPWLFAPRVCTPSLPLIIMSVNSRCSCKDCITAFLQQCTEQGREGRCPTCSREPVSESDLLEVIRTGKPGDVAGSVTLRKNDFRSSTKLDALLQNLRTSISTFVPPSFLTSACRCHSAK